ncbi:hypothetical protein [Dyadobacter sp. NIV53]|uniref:hypothetical protein n=1 Tax=Dyadobacter sp. NIV53 TaxID=2861765 RepID=UPI001C87096D|nr:hypothetical protein [Dyadobacter sp. NIV53]
MKTRIAVYGGTDLLPEIVDFVENLTKSLLNDDEVILVSGGFDHYKKHPERMSVDKVVMQTAKKLLKDTFNQRFETWLPKKYDRTKVERFKEGKVIEILGTSQIRRNKLVQNVDAIITIQGEDHTRNVIELALALNKPVLPLAFTGGQSEEMWKMYEQDIIKMLDLPESFIDQIIEMPAGSLKTGEVIADFVKKVSKKTCLILMPFAAEDTRFYDNYLKEAIIECKYAPHRIDQDDQAGNIPNLFKTALDRVKAIIVDISGNNPNVMYELGYVHANNIEPLIILRSKKGQKQNLNKLPFYLKQEMICEEEDENQVYPNIQKAVQRFLAAKR